MITLPSSNGLPPQIDHNWGVYSTYCFPPGLVKLPNEEYRLFNTSIAQIGQGFCRRPLAREETNLLVPPPLIRSCGQTARIIRVEWDVYAPDEDGNAPARSPADAPLETRPAGLLLYGSLRLEIGYTTRFELWPLTRGLPYGSLQDDLLLRGGVDLGRCNYQLRPFDPFAIILHVKPGYRPAREVHIRVHLHMEGS